MWSLIDEIEKKYGKDRCTRSNKTLWQFFKELWHTSLWQFLDKKPIDMDISKVIERNEKFVQPYFSSIIETL